MTLYVAGPRASAPPRAQLHALAADQHLAFTGRQAAAVGVSRGSLPRGERRGDWHQALPGVWVLGPRRSDLPQRTRESAAVLWGGPDSRLTGESAVELRDCWPSWRREDYRVQLLVPRGRGSAPVPWIHTIRTRRSTSARPEEWIDGLRSASVSRALLDLGASLTPHQIAAVMDQARFRGVLDEIELERLLEQHLGEPFTAAPRAALQLHRAASLGTKSREEDALLAAIIEAGLPIPLVNQVGALPNVGFVMDFVWPFHGVVAEVDGRRHQDAPQQLLDASRDQMLLSRAAYLMRIPAWRVRRELPDVVHELRRALYSRH